MKIKDIVDHLENYAPLSYQDDYDNAGLIIGSLNSTLKGVLICLDCTEKIIDEAIKTKANLIISHHPVLFSPIKKITGSNYVERVIIKSIKHDIAIYAIHTNLDNIYNGVNAKICKELGIKDYKILSPKKGLLKKLYTFCPKDKTEKVRSALFKAGAGVIGNYDECSFNTEGTGTFKAKEGTDPYVGKINQQHQENEIKIETVFPAYLENKIIQSLMAAHPYEEVAYDIIALDNYFDRVGAGMIGELTTPVEEKVFLKTIKSKLNTKCIRHTSLRGKKIKKVAVCGGSGNFLLQDAISQKADIFISADFKYHQFFNTENKIIIADIGHYESEKFTMGLLHEILKNKFSTFAIQLTKNDTNPINYF